MGDPAPPRAGEWGEARERARAEVREVFAHRERICPACGASSASSGRSCPECGAPYVARRAKRLDTRRARVVFVCGACVGVAVVGGVVALLAPGINHSKRLNAAASRRADQAAIALLVRQITAAQRLHVGRGRQADPGASAPAPARLRARGALVGELEAMIAADARARVRAGTLTGPVRSVSCSAYPSGTVGADRTLSSSLGAYACVAVNQVVRNGRGVQIAVLGDPFWARIDFARARMAWCKVTPRPGEGGAGTGPPPVPLAPACNLAQEFRGALP